MDEVLKEVTQSIKAVFDLTARIDERVKIFSNYMSSIDEKIEKLSDTQGDLSTKISILESRNGKELKADIEKVDTSLRDLSGELKGIERRLHDVEKSASNSEYKWKLILDFVYRTVGIVIVCYILYQMNLQTPPLP